MPVLYKVLTGLIALVGNLSLITTGEMSPIFIGLSFVMFVGYYRAIKDKPQAGRYTTAALSIAAFVIFVFDAFWVTRDVIVSVGHLSLLWHSIKAFDIKDPWDPLQVMFMSLIQLFLASELTRSIVFGVVFVVFMVGLVYSVVYSHFIKEGLSGLRGLHGVVFALTGVILVLTVFFFVATPRVKGGFLGKGQTRAMKSGFSEEVNLGGLGSIKEDYSVVMRAVLKPIPSKVPYWRGITYELYSDGQWFDIDDREEFFSKEGKFEFGEVGPGAFRQDIILEPLDTELVFAMKGLKGFQSSYRAVKLSEDGALYVKDKKSRRLRYIAISDLNPDRSPPQEDIHLQLPEGLDNLKALAEKLTENAVTPKQKAETILQYLKDNYQYSLDIEPPPEGQDPVEFFLFTQKKGFCEHFAGSMVLLLRAAKVPARLVTGYIGGQFNRYGRYFIVRQKDAHTWVEAWIDGQWKEFDPTPASFEGPPSQIVLFLDFIKLKWDRYVVNFSSRDQKNIIKTLSMPMERFLEIRLKGPEIRFNYWVFGTLVVLIAMMFLVRPLIYNLRYPLWQRRYIRLRKGLGLPETSAPSEVLMALRKKPPEKRHAGEEIIKDYLVRRFGRK